MNKQKILVNIFSNWMDLIVIMGLAFFVSPIIVHRLGNELYGVWTLIVQITGYFTVLDFGVNTAIVRFISMYTAQKNPQKANDIYNTSLLFFLIMSLGILLCSVIFGVFFPNLFNIAGLSPSYASVVFILVGLDIAFNLLFGVFSAALKALQEFLKLNIVSITLVLFKNLVLVIMLLHGYKLLSLAFIQISCSLVGFLLNYLILRHSYPFFHLRQSSCSLATLKHIFNYSIYSFVIAIAGRIIFLTDSIVIGRSIGVSQITFYAIPATLVDYLGRLVGALTAALLPVISSQDAVGDVEKNQRLYVTGTRYILIITLPVIYVLMTVGHDFIAIWMGAQYGTQSKAVLRFLLIGYVFAFPQWVAYSVLGGTSNHRFLAYVLTAEAIINLGLSIMLSSVYGIEGVAIGTSLPLMLINLFVIAPYACHLLGLPYWQYLKKSHGKSFVLFFATLLLYTIHPVHVTNYGQLVLYSGSIVVFWGIAAYGLVIEQADRQWLRQKGQEVFDNLKKRRSPTA
jgi:O-antigen/teichoic acid export membrane protein